MVKNTMGLVFSAIISKDRSKTLEKIMFQNIR